MNSQLTQMNQKPAVKNASLDINAFYRLALLVVPEAVVMMALSHAPVLCVLAGLGILALWLTVDVGPFRASSPKPAPQAAAGQGRSFLRNMAKAQWWSYFFCKAVIAFALMHSKITI